MPKPQKKFYLTDQAAFYLARLAEHTGENHGNVIEHLINDAAKSRGITATMPESIPEILTVAPGGPVLSAKQVERVNKWCHENNNDKTEFLKRHALRLAQNGWRDPDNQVLNQLSVDTLGKALFFGYEPAETPAIRTKIQLHAIMRDIHAELRRDLDEYVQSENLDWKNEIEIIRLLAADIGKKMGGMKATIELTPRDNEE